MPNVVDELFPLGSDARPADIRSGVQTLQAASDQLHTALHSLVLNLLRGQACFVCRAAPAGFKNGGRVSIEGNSDGLASEVQLTRSAWHGLTRADQTPLASLPAGYQRGNTPVAHRGRASEC